jgi:ESS family glutamate:Na+ symporter
MTMATMATASLVAARTLPPALAGLALMLGLGRAIGERLGLRHWGLPEALLAGGIGLLVAPSGPLPLVPPPVIELWERLPLILLTLVFATLLLAKPLPRLEGLWRPVSGQVSLALTLAFGQYLVGGLVVLLLLGPWLSVHPLMACLVEVAYEGGHGSAAAMGASYAALGFEGGEALGLAMATVGLLASTVVGGLVVVAARQLGWLRHPDALPVAEAVEAVIATAPPLQAVDPEPEVETPTVQTPQLWTRTADWGVNLALAGSAVLFGVIALALLRWSAGRIGGVFALVVGGLPVFPLALVGSLVVRLVLERSDRASLVSPAIQTQLGTVAADLLIASATACLDLSLLARDWLPLTVLASCGLAWNLAVVLLLGPRLLPADWFERGIIEFGQATGVAASGLLLLRMADPGDRSDALQAFSIKQLLLQPVLAGGLVTVIAPLAVSRWGLPLWTTLCGALVALWIGLGLLLARR